MIHRRYSQGERLDVAGLNEITVLIDRSLTACTEVGLNSWVPGQNGPPHRHEAKEQIFFVTSGTGAVRVGDETFRVQPKDFIYVPAGMEHQSIAAGPGPLQYLLFTEVFTGFGERGVPSDRVALATIEEVREYLSAGVPVGRHLADQLMIPMALAGGGTFRTLPPTRHSLTNIEVLKKFLDVEITVTKLDRPVWDIAISGR